MKIIESPQINNNGNIRSYEREIVQTTSGTRFTPDSVITGLIGLVMIVVGLIVIAKGGFDGPMSEPVVNMFGFTHTTTLGLIEIGIGLSLLVSAAARSRSAEVFFGAVLGIVGFVGAVQTDSFRESLALESEMAWIAALAGLVIVTVSLLLPRFSKNSTTITRN
jgi:hypothetical protein